MSRSELASTGHGSYSGNGNGSGTGAAASEADGPDESEVDEIESLFAKDGKRRSPKKHFGFKNIFRREKSDHPDYSHLPPADEEPEAAAPKKETKTEKKRRSAITGKRTFTAADKPFALKHVDQQTQRKFHVRGSGFNLHHRLHEYLLLANLPQTLVVTVVVFVVAAMVFAGLFWLQLSAWSFIDAERCSLSESGRPGYLNLFAVCITMLLTGDSDSSGIKFHPTYRFTLMIWQLMQAFAVVTQIVSAGIVFTKFARSYSMLRFSKWVVITNNGLHNRGRCLEFKVLNERGGVNVLCLDVHAVAVERLNRQLLEAHVTVTLCLSPRFGAVRRTYTNLAVFKADQSHMPMVWTISHLLDKSSPLHGRSWESLSAQSVEIAVVLSGYDPVTMDHIYSSHEYQAGHLLFDADFKDIATINKRGNLLEYQFDVSSLDVVTALKPINQAVKA